jgi:hypothetical protein
VRRRRRRYAAQLSGLRTTYGARLHRRDTTGAGSLAKARMLKVENAKKTPPTGPEPRPSRM